MIKIGNFTIGTIKEISEEYVRALNESKYEWGNTDFDFALCKGSINDIEEDVRNGNIDKFTYDLSEWYGMKYIITGFDSGDLTLIADYYGGGCMQSANICREYSDDEKVELIRELIKNVLRICHGSGVSDNSVIAADFSEYNVF